MRAGGRARNACEPSQVALARERKGGPRDAYQSLRYSERLLCRALDFARGISGFRSQLGKGSQPHWSPLRPKVGTPCPHGKCSWEWPERATCRSLGLPSLRSLEPEIYSLTAQGSRCPQTRGP